VTSKQKTYRMTMFTEAHSDHEKGLSNRAFFKTGDRSMSEDLVQDTFLKAWKYLLLGKKVEVMKAFLYHILNNLIIDEYRRRGNRAISLDALTEKGFEPAVENESEHAGTDSLIDALDGRAALLSIKKLPKACRKVMHMKYVQELSSQEMSDNTGRSKNAIAVEAHRGLEKLRTIYFDLTPCAPARA
jgi:RNA polymerase sigma-70 factor (ECF subfamily)